MFDPLLLDLVKWNCPKDWHLCPFDVKGEEVNGRVAHCQHHRMEREARHDQKVALDLTGGGGNGTFFAPRLCAKDIDNREQFVHSTVYRICPEKKTGKKLGQLE